MSYIMVSCIAIFMKIAGACDARQIFYLSLSYLN
uniref:Uncharacterized protein n=1 Tax=Anguilla anguilla TaxID=7936 RepID=A0A0E9PLJ5_ANGAN